MFHVPNPLVVLDAVGNAYARALLELFYWIIPPETPEDPDDGRWRRRDR
jgi:hypothetical protein